MYDQMNAVSMLRLLNCSYEERRSFVASLRSSVFDEEITRDRLKEYVTNAEALLKQIKEDGELNMKA